MEKIKADEALDEHELIDEIYNRLFEKKFEDGSPMPISFAFEYPDAKVIREYGYIKLNDDYVIEVVKLND